MANQNQYYGNTDTDVEVLDIQIPMVRVVLCNDDYTTFDFVISILMQIFNKSEKVAQQITMSIHKTGRGVAGTYPREIAETKVSQVHEAAEAAGYPLRAIIEE